MSYSRSCSCVSRSCFKAYIWNQLFPVPAFPSRQTRKKFPLPFLTNMVEKFFVAASNTKSTRLACKIQEQPILRGDVVMKQFWQVGPDILLHRDFFWLCVTKCLELFRADKIHFETSFYLIFFLSSSFKREWIFVTMSSREPLPLADVSTSCISSFLLSMLNDRFF